MNNSFNTATFNAASWFGLDFLIRIVHKIPADDGGMGAHQGRTPVGGGRCMDNGLVGKCHENLLCVDPGSPRMKMPETLKDWSPAEAQRRRGNSECLFTVDYVESFPDGTYSAMDWDDMVRLSDTQTAFLDAFNTNLLLAIGQQPL